MSNRTVISTAGNALSASLATLRSLGYTVTHTDNGLCMAENEKHTFIGEDFISLLGLVKLHQERGSAWQPTDAEVEACLAFESVQTNATYGERTDVWEVHGAVHILCVTSFGDPVEMNTHEAREFAAKLAKAISDAD